MKNWVSMKKGFIRKKDVEDFLKEVEQKPIVKWDAANAMFALFIITKHVELVEAMEISCHIDSIYAQEVWERYQDGTLKEFIVQMKKKMEKNHDK